MHCPGEEESELHGSDHDGDSEGEGSDASSYPMTTEVACSDVWIMRIEYKMETVDFCPHKIDPSLCGEVAESQHPMMAPLEGASTPFHFLDRLFIDIQHV